MKTSYLFGIVLGVLIVVGCQKKDEAEVPQSTVDNCSAEYSQGIGIDGRLWFQMRSFWVECEGVFGMSRPYCRWRQ